MFGVHLIKLSKIRVQCNGSLRMWNFAYPKDCHFLKCGMISLESVLMIAKIFIFFKHKILPFLGTVRFYTIWHSIGIKWEPGNDDMQC